MTRPNSPLKKESVKVFNADKEKYLADKAYIADTPWSRMIGLLRHQELPKREGLMITRCNSIHMFFMRFAIDAVFVDKNDHVVGLVENIKPWRLSPIFFKASYVIELPAGTIQETGTSKNDKIKIQK